MSISAILKFPVSIFLVHFLMDTIRDKQIGLLRLDSGFYSDELFNYLETRKIPIDYIVAVPMYIAVQQKIAA